MDPQLKALAARFLDFVYRATRLPMIVCDETGTIVCAVDRSRVGTKHAFAQRILAGEADELFVSAEDAARDPRMKEGCNCLLAIDGERVGTFGLAGPLVIARPLTRVAAAVIQSWAKEQRRERELRDVAERVLAGVAQVEERARVASGETQAVAKDTANASSEANAKIERTGLIVRKVQDVAQKSRLLSINGSVEASRAGEQGRAFGVVAREMLALAQDAREAASQVQATLGEVHAAIARLDGAMARSAALARSQSGALDEIHELVASLQRAVADLARGG